MATIRELIAAGFDVDAQLVVFRDNDDDHAFTVDAEARRTDDMSNSPLIALYLSDGFIMVADDTCPECEGTGIDHATGCSYYVEHGTDYDTGCVDTHTCDVRPVEDGGDLVFEGGYGAPGIGQSWKCTKCGKGWSRVGESFYDPADGAHILSPKDVV